MFLGGTALQRLWVFNAAPVAGGGFQGGHHARLKIGWGADQAPHVRQPISGPDRP